MKRMVFSGFGGQGVLTLGQMVASIAMNKGKQVTWMPSYGPEMRGGTANCSVIISDSSIGSPFVPGEIDIVVAMNIPSVMKFESRVAPGGTIVVNTSIVKGDNLPKRKDITVIEIDATMIAGEVGNNKVANVVMMAGLIKADLFSVEDAKAGIAAILGKGKANLVELNVNAIEKGLESL